MSLSKNRSDGIRLIASIHSKTSRVLFELLQGVHAGTILLGFVLPPRATGMTWSHVVAGDPQYAHLPSNSSISICWASGGIAATPRLRLWACWRRDILNRSLSA